MAIISNTFLTFSAIGNREDLIDSIYNISPVEVPLTSMMPKVKATATLHEWQTDSLAAAAANAVVQGDDTTSSYTFASAAATTRVGNRTQIARKDVIVSGTQDAVNKAGRVREIVYQMNKRAKELKRDIEFVLCSNQAPVTGNSSTAPQLRPVLSWFATNVSNGAGGSNGSASTARTDGTQRTFTESMLQDAMQNAWAQGGNPTIALTGPKQKRAISAFTGGATKFDKTEDKTLFAVVDVYVSDFGQLKIIPSRFTRGASTGADREVFVLDTSLWAYAELRPMQTIDLAKTGDNEKGMILTEFTLEARNEAGSALIADLV